MGVQELRAVWERLGESDPLWAVLSDPERKGGGWNLAEFMATGVPHAKYLRDSADQHGMSLGPRVLDFGCGVGRLSQALADEAVSVVGVDIAEAMLDAARRLNQHPDRVEYVHFDGRLLPFDDDSFDGLVSLIVVQHAPPAVQLATLLEWNRVVRPGGVIVFQAPNAPRASQPLAPEECQAEIVVLEAPTVLRPRATGMVRALVTNRGSGTWSVNEAIKLGNHWLADGAVLVADDGRTELPHELLSGEAVELSLLVRAPGEPGSYQLELDMVQEFVAWWAEHGSQPVRVEMQVSLQDTPEEASGRPPAQPSHSADRVQRVLDGNEGIEMHAVPLSLVQGLFRHVGSTVLSASSDGLAGQEWDSRTYVVRVGGR